MAATRTPGITTDTAGKYFIDKHYRGARICLRLGQTTIEQAEARVFGDAAVVLTCLTLLDRTGAEGKQYWNSKTFVRQDGDWRCVAWHVTERGPKGTACAPGGADSGT